MNQDDADTWNGDPVTKEISEHIKAMPDRPKVVVALINWNKDNDGRIASILSPHKAAFINFKAYKIFGRSFGMYLFGFESDTPIILSDFFIALSLAPFDEGAIYVEGEARLRLAPVKSLPSEQNQDE